MNDGPAPCVDNVSYSNNLSAQNLNITYKGFKSRANISWKPMDDVLLYYTWSQGFRPGGFNRGLALRGSLGQPGQRRYVHLPDAVGLRAGYAGEQ